MVLHVHGNLLEAVNKYLLMGCNSFESFRTCEEG